MFFQAQENVDSYSQRWFYGGKLLGDKMLIEDAHIQAGYIVQVIVNTEKQGIISQPKIGNVKPLFKITMLLNFNETCSNNNNNNHNNDDEEEKNNRINFDKKKLVKNDNNSHRNSFDIDESIVEDYY